MNGKCDEYLVVKLQDKGFTKSVHYQDDEHPYFSFIVLSVVIHEMSVLFIHCFLFIPSNEGSSFSEFESGVNGHDSECHVLVGYALKSHLLHHLAQFHLAHILRNGQ